MKNSITALLLTLTLTLAMQQLVSANEPEAPENLTENCTRCHDSGMYTRTDRRVSSLAGLGKQVRMCNVNTGANLFDDEVDEIIDYLNSSFYQFGK